MKVKFVFSSVPAGTMADSCVTIPVAPKDHDHHFQVEIDFTPLSQMLKMDDTGALRALFIGAAYKALKAGNHESSFLYVTIIGELSSSPTLSINDDISMHQAVESAVNKAICMAMVYCDLK
ncbi:hypothetical protein [Pseudomonas sp.]|uniref:hypothetical protein n=1 Tax=Pseudomonas sp. TaxID=306 RepID=UPI002FCC90EA